MAPERRLPKRGATVDPWGKLRAEDQVALRPLTARASCHEVREQDGGIPSSETSAELESTSKNEEHLLIGGQWPKVIGH
jgi:hypothetical protein